MLCIQTMDNSLPLEFFLKIWSFHERIGLQEERLAVDKGKTWKVASGSPSPMHGR